jgi:hypothetical protein
LSILKIEMWRGTDLPCHGYLVVKCHTSSVNIWVCSKHGCSGNKCLLFLNRAPSGLSLKIVVKLNFNDQLGLRV